MIEKIEKPAVCVESNYDEAFLIGTKDEFIKFAHTILQMIEGPFQTNDFLGVMVERPISEISLTEPMSDIVLDNLVIVKTKVDRRLLINKLRVFNCDEPIYWEGYDEQNAKNI